ncbi:MAG: hypothetical protein SPI77_04135 [Corynebacterium sp.]|nr:hypothetical protein [Corynebacterium sp.]
MTTVREISRDHTVELDLIHQALLNPGFYRSGANADETTITVTPTAIGNVLVHIANSGAEFTYTVEPFNTTGFRVTGHGRAAGRDEITTRRTHTFTPCDGGTTHEDIHAEYDVTIPLVGGFAEKRWADQLDEEIDGRAAGFIAYQQWAANRDGDGEQSQ